MFIQPEKINIGDVFLIKDSPDKRVRHTLVLYEDKGSVGTLDKDDFFIIVGKGEGIKESQYLKAYTNYFLIRRLNELT